MPSTSRRRLLRTLPSLAGFTAFGGCSALHAPSPTSLRELYARNNREADHQLRIRVSADGERVSETTVEVSREETSRLDCEWPTEASSYTLEATFDGADWQTHVLDSGDAECITAEILEPPNGVGFGVFHPCPTGIGDTCERVELADR